MPSTPATHTTVGHTPHRASLSSRCRRLAAAGLLLAGTLAAVGVDGPPAATPPTSPKPTQTATPPTLAEEKPLDFPGLHNVVTYAPGLLSGSVPEGEVAFDTLQAWGVKTIISVDGAEPEVEKAKARGMRYVHLPIGYNGFDEQRKLQLVRAVRDLDGPIYMHCHHGKHRSAGAAGTVAVSLGWIDTAQALGRMKVSGTAPNYKGLYRCTEQAARLTAEIIDSIPAHFPERSRPSGMVEAMVGIDDAYSHLLLIEKAGWKPPADHPDLVPVAEAGRLGDLFRLLANEEEAKAAKKDKEAEEAKASATDFGRMLRESERLSSAIERGLEGDTLDIAALSSALKSITASCKECHVKHRD